MSNPIKILTVGSALGQLSSLFSKVKAIDAKHGKFEILLCTGDFFGPISQPGLEGEKEVEQLLEGKLEVPMTTYIMQGQLAIPPKVVEKVAKTGGEICSNVFMLGKAGYVTTATGLKIACFGGAHDPALFASASEETEDTFDSPYFTAKTLRNFLAYAPSSSLPLAFGATKLSKMPTTTLDIDILLTHVFPPSITRFSQTASFDASNWSAPAVDEVLKHARPKYHFASGGANGSDNPIFWEREPFVWDGPEVRSTRFASLGAFGSQPEAGKKQRWFYAFTITPETNHTGEPPPAQSRPPNATPNPFGFSSAKGPQKRLPEDEGSGAGSYIWGNNVQHSGNGRNPGKRPRLDPHGNANGPDAPPRAPPEGYVCRKCGSAEDCPQLAAAREERKAAGDKPPEGYVCKKCGSSEHYIRECPQANQLGDTGGRKPPDGYTCRACGSENHFIKDCPNAAEKGRSARGPVREIGPDECWFCLSNPRLTKHLVVSIGSECYLTLPKGQLPPTPADGLGMVPGGGHILIIPIEHHPTLLSIPPEISVSIISEIETYKSALRSMYAAHGCSAATFEVARLTGKGGHAHIQVVPVPNTLSGAVEDAFRREGEMEGVDWQEDPEAALSDGGDRRHNYFRVELPDGKTMVHLLRPGKQFNLQFGRTVLAQLMGLEHRTDWKACAQTEQEERADALAFKEAFADFDPTL